MTRSAQDRVAAAVASLPWLRDGIVVHGWRLAGPGPARHGWWYQHVTGACTWLGPTADAVVQRAKHERATRAAARFPDVLSVYLSSGQGGAS